MSFAKKLRSPSHSQPDQLLSRTSAKFLQAEPLQLFFAQVNTIGHFSDRPGLIQTCGDLLPKLPDPGIETGWSCETQDIMMDQVDPPTDCRRIQLRQIRGINLTVMFPSGAFMKQPENRQSKTFRIKLSNNRCLCRSQWLLSRSLLISYPAEILSPTLRCLERV
jgi:hypothetical protein